MIFKFKKILTSITCILLASCMLFLSACSCVPDDEDISAPTTSSTTASSGDKNDSNSTTSSSPATDSTNGGGGDDLPDIIEPGDGDFEELIFNETESFVCELIYSDLSSQYVTFTGYVTLPALTRSGSTRDVYGISFVNYDDGYIDENGKVYFSAGFIAFSGEPLITDDQIATGLEIHSLDNVDNEYSYIYTHTAENISSHCVVNNKYVTYDIVDGGIEFTEEPFVWGMNVDPSRGNIYNYDTKEFVYIVEEQDFVPVSGASLVTPDDYQAIIDEANLIILTQNDNFSYENIESYVSLSKDAMNSYLLGLQEETFMGIRTQDLIEAAKKIDPLQHLQIGVSENGIPIIKIIDIVKLASLEEKIVTTVICAVAIVGGLILNQYSPTAAGFIIGAAMEIFAQVVIDSTPVSDIQWAKVGVAAVTGAIAGTISAGMSNSQFFTQHQFISAVVDTVCDAILGGSEFFVNSYLIDGKTFEEACQEFGYGFVTGAVCSAGFKIGGKLISLGKRLIKAGVKKVVSSIADKQITKLGKEMAENGLSELQEQASKKLAKDGAEKAVSSATETSADLVKLKSLVRKATDWSDEIIEKIRSVDEYRALKNANLEEYVINGRKCLGKIDIDLDYTDKNGITNRQRMALGEAPIDSKTGKPLELHHFGQKADSPLVELTEAEHRTGDYINGKKNQSLWHDNTIDTEVHQDESLWGAQRKAYWKARLAALLGE